MPNIDAIAAIILAAGSSSRMAHGYHKLLLPLGEKPVLAHVVEATLQSQVSHIVVVLGHQSPQITAALDNYIHNNKISLQENPDYKQGMSTSLRAGLQALSKHHNLEAYTGAIVLLGDQPFISSHLLDTLIATRQQTGKSIVAPCYHGKRGNPVLFAASLFAELATVTGDEGGRSVIAKHAAEVESVELSDAQAQYDVDTWEAYQAALTAWQQQQTRGSKHGDI
ncbi:molybdenum cofactor cytidylyltransferase [Dictyobacter alpinus]|uniref:Molybdenum cofactor cytidylyltransferase n=1 Tax=Dictyobacter alpinus TaxID=2014873 RepID=A0A402B0Z6_9CHLR|nr:nucleotidyltransferase family protein [Dictyobacter alpinus]GCE25012.1 molybdenum cofactor cytidylyltransferase [Dictyobacter alpinus]